MAAKRGEVIARLRFGPLRRYLRVVELCRQEGPHRPPFGWLAVKPGESCALRLVPSPSSTSIVTGASPQKSGAPKHASKKPKVPHWTVSRDSPVRP